MLSLVIAVGLIALIVIVIVLAQIDVVQNDAEDFRANVQQDLSGAARDAARGLAAMDDEQYTINERGGEHGVCEGADGRRVNDDVIEG